VGVFQVAWGKQLARQGRPIGVLDGQTLGPIDRVWVSGCGCGGTLYVVDLQSIHPVWGTKKKGGRRW